MSRDELEPPPTHRTGRDFAYLAARTAIAAIPFAGGSLDEIFGGVLQAPLTKRRDRWLQDLWSDLIKLQKQMESIDLDALFTDDSFVSWTLRATQEALKTEREERHSALRSALLNTAIDNQRSSQEWSDLMRDRFFQYISELTPEHLRALRNHETVLKGPAQVVSETTNHPFTYLAARFAWRLEPQLWWLVQQDLRSRGLIRKPVARSSAPLTPLGKSFLAFIRDPLESES